MKIDFKANLKTTAVLFALLCGSFSAKADIVVGRHLSSYGTLVVVGHPNKEAQSETTFSLRLETSGTTIEDRGVSEGRPLNKSVQLRAGQYTIFYSHTHSDLEIREGQTTVVKLQKVSAAALMGTDHVSLLKERERPDSDEDDSRFEKIGTWHRKGSVTYATTETQCETYRYNPMDYIPIYKQYCHPKMKTDPVVHPWSAAYFYVLPGTYSMRWTAEDGTTHQEDAIEVK